MENGDNYSTAPWRNMRRSAVATWCSEWICRMRGGLVHHTIMIPAALSLPGRCCEVLAVGRAPTIFQNDWFCTRISNFFQSPIFRLLGPCFLKCVWFYFSFIRLHVYAFAINSMVHCGSAFEPGASGLPYYCTYTFVRSWCTWLAVWIQTPKKKVLPWGLTSIHLVSATK